jgi:predicted nucleic acid-binding protein
LSFDLARTLRRLKPEKIAELRRRPDRELDFIAAAYPLDGPPLLLDSCVYIDVLRAVAPPLLRDLLNARLCNHSAVCIAELLHPFGRLGPAHKQTTPTLTTIGRIFDVAVPAHRVAAPDPEVWCDAGVLAGLLGRVRGYGPERRQTGLNDCLIYLQAAKLGHTVLTRNVVDFDLLNQVVPQGRVLFYRIHAARRQP